MTLYQRTILIIVTTFIALLVIVAVASDVILLSSFSSLEKAQILSHSRNVSNQIEDKLKRLDVSAQEVAERVEKGGASAAVQLLSDWYMRGHAVDLVALYDGTGQLVTIRGFDCKEMKSTPVPAEQLRALAGLTSLVASKKVAPAQGVVNIAGSPLMVAFRPVKAGSGSKPGMAAIGWFVDNAEMERLFKSSGLSISIHDFKDPRVPDAKNAAIAINKGENVFAAVLDETSVAGYVALKDLFGQNSYIVCTVEKRTLYGQGKSTIVYVFTALFLTGATFCCVMLIFIRDGILSRLQSLTSKVASITRLRDISTRLPLSERQDELNILTVSINGMLESLEQAEAVVRESEERYRMLFEGAPDAILIIGLDGDEAGQIVAANQAAAQQHGYTVEELCRLSIYELNTPDTNKIAGDLFANVVGGEWVTAEIWHLKKDGSQFPVEIHAGLIKINGKSYILGFDRDITQRKLTEETNQMHLQEISLLNDELRRKASDLAAANSELETFNYSVSHDMRGPLTRISGYCQMLLESDSILAPVAREYVEQIYKSEQWLNDMIDALIQMAQLNRVQIVSETVNLSAIAAATLKELSLEHPERIVKTDVEADLFAVGDSRLLKIVMINLLSNAWKYSSGKSDALIEFGAERSGPVPVYYVRDNGAGFDMKDVGKLFRVFSRLHDASRFKGTGIGLATVQRIVFRHGGNIWAEAAPGAGATFFFTLS